MINTNNMIDADRLNELMKSGRGKQKDRLKIKTVQKNRDVTATPEKRWKRMKENTEWLNTELELVTGVARPNIGNIRNRKYYTVDGGKNKSSDLHTIEAIAEALDVDPDYLTGKQSKMRVDPEKEKLKQQRKKDAKERLENMSKLRTLKNFLKFYGLRIIYDDEISPTKYWLRDDSDCLIRDGDDVKDLIPLMEIMFNHLRTGSSIIQLFIGEDMDIVEF